MSDTASSPAAPATSLGLDALQALLTHDHELLSIRELGRLSVCSSEVQEIFEQALVWKKEFESSAQIGRTFREEGTIFEFQKHGLATWFGEPGLLGCFSDPSDAVMARVGYKRAAGCLRGRSCARCGKMAADANPLTMTRICEACAVADEGSFLITKTKAKESFLLGEADLKNLPCASFASRTITGKDCTSVVFLISDVKDAAFAKYGGADGLAAEFARRTSAAVERYTKSQSTAKPQKKRPKIERMAARPADNLRQLVFFGEVLPVGTAHNSSNGRLLAMTHSAKCKLCDRKSNIENILMHERLDHGIDLLDRPDRRATQPIPEPTDLSRPTDVPGATEELVQLLSSASVAYTSSHEELDELMWSREVKKNCLISLDPSGGSGEDEDDKVTISVDEYDVTLEGCGFGGVDICYQLGSGTVPIKLLKLSFGEESGNDYETSEENFDGVKEALGLAETSPSDLLLVLMSRALPLKDIRGLVSEVMNYQPPSRKAMPILHAMSDILKSG